MKHDRFHFEIYQQCPVDIRLHRSDHIRLSARGGGGSMERSNLNKDHRTLNRNTGCLFIYTNHQKLVCIVTKQRFPDESRKHTREGNDRGALDC